ncbi:MAG: PAS domain S-box protein [Desulfuromonadaceae bacterium]|nr:PAS domain S-box protein [Desulfuromonadaceae bacterium]
MDRFSGFLNNAALMLILCVIYDTFSIYSISNKRMRDGLTGLLVGLISIAVMLSPWSLQPGVFFDTRWVLISLCGLFFGLIPTTVAVIIAGAFRLYQGGAGGIAGTLVIVVTACVGLIWKYWKDKHGKPLNWMQLYTFGVVVQLAMLSCMFFMPADLRLPILKKIILPILLIYPVLTTIIGLILKKQEDRRATDKALVYSTSLATAALESTPDGVLIVDSEGKITRWNQKYIDLWQVPAELLKPPFEEAPVLTHIVAQMDSPEKFLAKVTELYKRPEESSADTLYLADGRIFDRYSQPQKIGDEIVGRFWSFRDITERKKDEDNLRETNAYLDNLFDYANAPIIVWDIRFKITRFNKAFETLTGRIPDEVIGCDISMLFPAFQIDNPMALIKETLSGDRWEGVEIPILHLNGTVSIVLWNSATIYAIDGTTPVSIIAQGQDITERKLAEIELSQQKALFEAIFKCIPDAIVYTKVDREVVGVNPAFTSVFGFAIDELAGKKTSFFYESLEEYERQGRIRFNLTAAEHSLPYEVCYRKKDGSIFPGETLGTVITSANDTIMGYIGVIRDITERKRAEDERTNLERQILHTQKLESLGVLAGGIAHDFNNILTAVIGNADLALMRINPESPAVDNLHNIEKAAARAADLAKQMLAYSGKGKFVISNHDINGLLEEMLHILQVSISKKAVLRLNRTRPLPSVEADATQIRQIIMNLVINASEAVGDKSGVIAITTGCMDCDSNYLKDVWLDENIGNGLYVFIEIADTGCGMDKETMAKLFDPFFTTKFTGRGLGMAAVLGIIRGHKGAIKVYSEPGKGSTFKILLPASGKPAEIFNIDTRNDNWKGSGTVLLVDDEETIRGIGVEMLKELGFNVVTANDGREAIQAYKARIDISFVILDLTMPHMDGEQCFRELRMLNPEVKVIMSSGFSELEVTQKFVGKGLAGFIQKPYKFSVLREGVMALYPVNKSPNERDILE